MPSVELTESGSERIAAGGISSEHVKYDTALTEWDTQFHHLMPPRQSATSKTTMKRKQEATVDTSDTEESDAKRVRQGSEDTVKSDGPADPENVPMFRWKITLDSILEFSSRPARFSRILALELFV
ncbi:hypothetical protein B0H14DRAFT_2653905 [Mycena olivaceomarginata]|nr:hypothetical protein B0H14DRAFT_2653905 [Mycena olivaceomarginata]